MRKANKLTNLNKQDGQIAIEFILLLVVVVVLYMTIFNMVAKRDPGGDPENSGFIIKAWSNIISTIGGDHPDDDDP